MGRNYLCQVGRTILLLCVLLLLGSAATEAQEDAYTIRGTVVDAGAGRPLPNITVVLRGSGLQTRTNRAGEYTLVAKVPPGDYTLQFALLGRGTAAQDITLGAERAVQVAPVTLEESALELEGLVVTGTGAPTEKRALGNTIATVPGELVNEAPAAETIDQALQGKVTGAVISENSGQPGGGVSIRLRGTSSIFGGAEPLIVVDGVIIDNSTEALVGLGANATRGGAALSNRLADISPQDVERVEVIKGAAAAALYGSRANNGVIQIFTKRGSQGEPRISLSSSLEMSRTPDTYDLNLFPQAGLADVIFGGAPKIGAPVERFDFQDEIFRTGLGGNLSVSVAGGNVGTSYYISGNYQEEEGILESSDYRKVSVRGKLTQQVTDWLEVTGSANFIDSEAAFVPEGEQTFGVLTSVIFGPTTFNPSFDPTIGRFPFSPVLKFNPLDVLANWEAPEDVVRFIGSFEATLRPRDDLNFRYLLGFDDYRQENRFFRPPFSESLADPGLVQNPILTSRQLNHDLTAEHEATLSESLGLTSLLGFRYTDNEEEVVRAAAQGLVPGVRLIEGATQFASESRTELRTLGGWIQERLNFRERLFLTGGVNVEAASAFGADQRWQLFPRLGASWVVNDEPFWEGSPMSRVFSTLRLRGAYGETGGQPPGAFLGENFFFGVAFSARPGFVPGTTLGNPNLEPERQREWEGGFEAGFFRDRAMLEFTFYDQETTDLILPVPLPPSSGVARQWQNIGVVSNRGVEIALNTINLDRPGLTWRSRFQFATNKNEVERLRTASDTLFIPGGGYPNAVIEGQPIGVFYGRSFVRNEQGEVVIDPATGLPQGLGPFRILGDPNPDFTASFLNTLMLRDNLEFNFLLDGRFGNDVANFTRRILEFFGAGEMVEEEIRRQVSGEPPLKFALNRPRLLTLESFIEDASFVKVRELSVRYRLNEAWARRLGAETASIRVGGRNLYTFTDYSGLDPEVNLFSSNTVARGVDFATTPIPRSLVFGMDFTF